MSATPCANCGGPCRSSKPFYGWFCAPCVKKIETKAVKDIRVHYRRRAKEREEETERVEEAFSEIVTNFRTNPAE